MKSLPKFFLSFCALLITLSVCISIIVSAMPSQQEEDTNTWPHSGAVNGLSGVASRPFVTDLSVTFDNGTTKSLLSGLTAANGVYTYQSQTGSVVPVISATNLCTPSSSGTCYTTPNRISISFNCNTPDNTNGMSDFNTTSCEDFMDATFDVTINMNAYYDKIEWYFMNGGLEFYSYDQDTKVLRVKAQAHETDTYNNPTGNNCCTCNPPSNCDVNVPRGIANLANFLVAVGNSNEAYRGAFFATRYAWMGFMDLQNKQLQYYLTGASKRPDGVATTYASLTTFFPRDMLARVFPNMNGQLNSDKLNVTRNGQPVAGNTLTWSTKAQGQFGTSGLMLKVSDVTFSVPIYGVGEPSSAAKVSAFISFIILVISVFCF